MHTDRSAFCSAARSLRNARSSRSLSYARCSAADRDPSTLSLTSGRPTRRLSLRAKRSATMIDRYRKKIAAMVIQLAKDDPNLRVRRYAMTVLRSVAEMIQNSRKTGS